MGEELERRFSSSSGHLVRAVEFEPPFFFVVVAHQETHTPDAGQIHESIRTHRIRLSLILLDQLSATCFISAYALSA